MKSKNFLGTSSSGSTGGLVYSTDTGRMCPGCRQPQALCSCKQVTVSASKDGVVRVSRETKGRSGKAVTLIKGLGLELEALTALAKQLKAAAGTGGTIKDGVIEIQGDHCDRMMVIIAEKGFVVKRAGG